MFGKAKNSVKKAASLPVPMPLPATISAFRKKPPLNMADIASARLYISEHWQRLLREHPTDDGTLIGLPHPYIVPSTGNKDFLFEEQYYWDSYFTSLGFAHSDHQELVEGMLENLIYLFQRFGLIPNASRMYMTSRSHPPLLTSFIFHVYDTYQKSNEWLQEHIAIAEQEYQNVWMRSTHPQWHNVHEGLSRYYDINVLHDLAEAESGWDMTPRFERKCLDFLPVDLNALLYKYEIDFARAAEILGKSGEASVWRSQAEERKENMNRLMWGKLRGFFFDYNYAKGELGGTWSLAGFYPMWVGMVDATQANRMVENLIKFTKKGGLTTTTRPLIDMSIFGSLKTQWAYPNGWAPLHLIVIEALERYGYHETAKDIATRWLKTNLDWYKKHGVFAEKYNVVNPTKRPMEGMYPSQDGFGWTNAVFENLCEKYLDGGGA